MPADDPPVPYRAPDRPEALPPSTPAPRQVEYPPNPRSGHFTARRFYARYALTAMGAAAALATGSAVAAAAVGGFVVARDLYLLARGARSAVRLHAKGGQLLLERRGEPTRAIPLRDLDDVELETRESHRANYVVRADGILGSGASFAVDTGRVVLRLNGEEPESLTEDFISHTYAVNALAAIRRMLRAHGWIPKKERVDAL